MVILGNFNYDTATIMANKLMGFDLSATQSRFYLFLGDGGNLPAKTGLF